MKVLLMADKKVGIAITKWMLEHYQQDIAAIISTDKNQIWKMGNANGVITEVYKTPAQIQQFVKKRNLEIHLGILAWWPFIVKKPLIDLPHNGFINMHPSLLPYNRGKHPNFWAIVEKVPFGVSLHKINEDIDSGEIVAQKSISRNWVDNGETLYFKSEQAMINLFMNTYPTIRENEIRLKAQNLKKGSFRKAKEIDEASKIDLDRIYKARDLLNLLRARTFAGHPSCWFDDNGEIFEVRINIQKKEI